MSWFGRMCPPDDRRGLERARMFGVLCGEWGQGGVGWPAWPKRDVEACWAMRQGYGL